jgi:hypothetical protein
MFDKEVLLLPPLQAVNKQPPNNRLSKKRFTIYIIACIVSYTFQYKNVSQIYTFRDEKPSKNQTLRLDKVNQIFLT